MIKETSRAIEEAERLLVITHSSPDGDGLGSMMALKLGLEQKSKIVTAVCVDPIPKPFQFLPNIESVQRDCFLGDYDRIIIIDCGDLKRTGLAGRIREVARLKQKIINIDHHQKNDLHKLAAINFIRYESSSAAEMVFFLLKTLRVQFDKRIATCLLTGLYNDTGGFKHSNTSAEVLRLAAKLMSYGAKLKTISDNIAHYKTVPTLKIWGVALSRLQYHPKLRLITSVITEEDLATSGAYHEDLAGCVNLINSIPDAKAAMLLYEMPDHTIKVSIRTERSNIDISKIANIFGGRGMKKAAGFSFPGRLRVENGHWRII